MKSHPTRRAPHARSKSSHHQNQGESPLPPGIRLARTATLALITAWPAGAALAEDSTKETFDSIWSLATLYKDDSNPILQEFKLRGRYQGQYYKTDTDRDDADNWEDRRSRFGFDAKLFEKKVEIRADFQSNDGFRDVYDGLVDAYIRFKPVKDLSFTLGRTKPLIGQYDWLESTNTQPTFERSQIFGQLQINRATSFTVEHKIDAFSWRAGIYNNDTPSSTGGTGSWGDGEFGDFNGGVSYSVGLGYDFKEQVGTEKADFRLDWLHSEREDGDLVLGRYDDILGATFWVKEGPLSVVLEGFYGTGGTGQDSDVFGFYLQSMYDIVPGKFQLVGRYSFSHSSGETGVRPQSRYEATSGALRGDSYNAFYLGGQYFIYGDKLKLLAGAEYAALGQDSSADRYDGYTFLSGIRFSF